MTCRKHRAYIIQKRREGEEKRREERLKAREKDSMQNKAFLSIWKIGKRSSIYTDQGFLIVLFHSLQMRPMHI